MKKSFINIVYFVVLLAVLGMKPARASEDLMGLENGKVFYKSCKAALSKNLSDEKFKETFCYYHITGWLQGAYYFAIHTTVQNPSDKCAYVYQRIEEDVNGRMCLPEKISVKEVAISYVEYVEKQKKLGQIEVSPLGDALLSQFNCNK